MLYFKYILYFMFSEFNYISWNLCYTLHFICSVNLILFVTNFRFDSEIIQTIDLN